MREITGKQVFAVTAGAFGIIIAVNLLMAYKAVSTFPGLEVKNSYVASQTFDADRRAQLALGWTLTPDYTPGQLSLAFTDAAGGAAAVVGLSVLVGRTTEAREDQRPVFARENGVFVAPLDLRPGLWMMQVEALNADGVTFRQRIDLRVKG
jgi:nitrogen fixation protein FixH